MKSEIEKDYLFKEKNNFFVSVFRIFKYKGYKMGLLRYASFAEMKRYIGV